MLIGLHQAQFTEITPASPRTKNRLPSVLTQIRPVLERVFAGEILSRTLVLDSLIHYEGPTKLAAAGRGRVLKWMRNRAKKDPAALVDAIFAALAERIVTVPDTAAAELVIPQLAANIKALQAQRDTIAGQVEEMLESFPLAQVLMSMPGVGITTASNILLSIGDCQDFADAAHLAAYAGIAPTTRQSGTSVRGEFPTRTGNKQLKNAMFRSAWIASNCHPASRDYYLRKRGEGQKHNAAVMWLARSHCNVIYPLPPRPMHPRRSRAEPRPPAVGDSGLPHRKLRPPPPLPSPSPQPPWFRRGKRAFEGSAAQAQDRRLTARRCACASGRPADERLRSPQQCG
ncbi:transposase [Corynebacterium sp. LK19]|uniref:transposase n=1 Tax=Corynebacterium sp. LK19 TaxID=2022660 RepID=UPI00351A430B